MIIISERIQIPEDELVFATSRSGGPGGQNVNKVSTRVALRFDVQNSPSIPDDLRLLIMTRLAKRISHDGILQVIVQDTRSQKTNKDLAVDRFVALLQQAMRRPKPRRRTSVPVAARQRRLEGKHHRSRTKQQRGKTGLTEE